MSSPAEAAKSLWSSVDANPTELEHLQLHGTDPVLPSSFALGGAAVGCVGTVSLSAACFLGERTGRNTPDRAILASADITEAAISFRSERYLRINGSAPGALWAPLSGDFPTSDGSYVRIHCNFPNHALAALKAMGLPPTADRAALAAAISVRRAQDVQESVEANGGCASCFQTLAEWKAHPQYSSLLSVPPISVTQLVHSPPKSLPPPSNRPLSGIRVLDLTRVLAGPVCGRNLAAYGADVLHVSAPHLPALPSVDPDTTIGKRSCHIDLTTEEGTETLRNLVKDCDVFLQSYRPGSLAARGFGPADLASINPNITYISITAYGSEGPWSHRRGFDSLVQLASGIGHEESVRSGQGGAAPRALPCQALDYATGWMAALGTIEALRRRAKSGGAWLVECSLARTAIWLDGLGRVEQGFDAKDIDAQKLEHMLESIECGMGVMEHVKMPGRVEGERPAWALPPPTALGEHPATWW
ncbi:hypothetical protein HK104_010487 [Borealophlyctis nickersoniae]|nr:hypothetical protein HK104_010487 [Borealophlyctis nickersoniae]